MHEKAVITKKIVKTVLHVEAKKGTAMYTTTTQMFLNAFKPCNYCSIVKAVLDVETKKSILQPHRCFEMHSNLVMTVAFVTAVFITEVSHFFVCNSHFVIYELKNLFWLYCL